MQLYWFEVGRLAGFFSWVKNERPRQYVVSAFFIITAISASFPSISIGQISAENVLVLYNQASDDGYAIAQHYQQTHPGVELLGLTNISTAEEVSADYYLNNIRPQVLSALSPSIDVIVTTKDLPLRIRVGQDSPEVYTDPFGIQRPSIYPFITIDWQRYSSLESELARIDSISTWQQMGDQTYMDPGGYPDNMHQSRNPYFNKPNESFDHEVFGTRLTSRLDGFSVGDVTSAIDKAQQAFMYPTSALASTIILDDDPNGHFDLMAELNTKLIERAYPVVYDTTSTPVLSADQSVIGYVSHGTHSASLHPDYIPDQLDFNLADGSVFLTHESFNAITFDAEETINQGLVAEWLAAGGTAGVGNVQEPQNSVETVTNAEKLFTKLLDGYTWAESAWAATCQLSYVNTVVGDPLMSFRELLPGDANRDGKVDIGDLGEVCGNYGESGQPGSGMWTCGDFDGNGIINVSDLGVISTNWGATASWYVGDTVQTVPEPSILIFTVAGMVTLFAFRRRAGH